MKKILIIDNYDSFVYNIAQLFGKLSTQPVVFRNNKITLNDIKKMEPDAIVLSPGPGHPLIKNHLEYAVISLKVLDLKFQF